MQFADKVVVITGAGSGIGRTCALRFAAEGGKVVVAEYNTESGQATVQQISEAGGMASFVQTDVSNSASVQAMIQYAVSTYGRLDVLYNNAGVAGEVKPVADYSEDVFARTMGVDLFGVFTRISSSRIGSAHLIKSPSSIQAQSNNLSETKTSNPLVYFEPCIYRLTEHQNILTNSKKAQTGNDEAARAGRLNQ